MKRKVQPRIKRERLWGVLSHDGTELLAYTSRRKAEAEMEPGGSVINIVVVRAPKPRKGAK